MAGEGEGLKVEFIKHPGGGLTPATDIEAERMARFKNGELYTVEIKATRNPGHHRKMFAFLNFCFAHWSAENSGLELADEATQFDTFRRNLTVLAGFRDVTYTIDGRTRVEAKSLAFASMEKEEFERCYRAMVTAATKHVFGGCENDATWNKLLEFF